MPLDGSTYETDETLWFIQGRETLLRCGWSTGSANGHGGSVCIMAALPVWGRQKSKVDQANAILVKAIAELGFGQYDHAVRFNEHPGVTFDDVLAVYDRAIEISRSVP